LGEVLSVNEKELRRHLDEAHRQLLERDNAYRFHDEEVRSRDMQIEELCEHLAEAEAWAHELEARTQELHAWAQELDANTREMQATRAWRFAVWLRSLRADARRLVRLGR
jgi:hypothetical protein